MKLMKIFGLFRARFKALCAIYFKFYLSFTYKKISKALSGLLTM
jgi:hypothetical protein